MKRFFTAMLSLFLISGCASGKEKEIRAVFEKDKSPYLVYITKSNFTLEIYNRNMKKLKSCLIGYGLNPDKKAKIQAGDCRTPEGVYRINSILSMDADTSTESYRRLKEMNTVYFSASHGHSKYGKPDEDLGQNVYGPRFFGLDYPNEDDRIRYKKLVKEGIIKSVNGKIQGIGSGIGIHGNSDEQSIGHLCSRGCIRMYNRDVVELDRYIRIGTPVIITDSE